ncbi:ZNRF2 ligase, partial [Atractosteus spatula]|nr:ZNRF2 ligase [Atractosteus spatula]
MGAKQSSPAANGRTRAYSGSDLPSGTSAGPGHGRTAAASLNQAGLNIPSSGSQESGSSTPEDGTGGGGHGAPRLLIGSLPSHLSPHLFGGRDLEQNRTAPVLIKLVSPGPPVTINSHTSCSVIGNEPAETEQKAVSSLRGAFVPSWGGREREPCAGPAHYLTGGSREPLWALQGESWYLLLHSALTARRMFSLDNRHPASQLSWPFAFLSCGGLSFKCPVCSKFVPSDEMDLHLVMCLTKPRATYNEDVLTKDAGECAICLEELVQGDTIARLTCLCIYHKGCIDEWFEVNRSCPEHPSD